MFVSIDYTIYSRIYFLFFLLLDWKFCARIWGFGNWASYVIFFFKDNFLKVVWWSVLLYLIWLGCTDDFDSALWAHDSMRFPTLTIPSLCQHFKSKSGKTGQRARQFLGPFRWRNRVIHMWVNQQPLQLLLFVTFKYFKCRNLLWTSNI